MKIKVYSSPTCSYCDKEKEFLKEHNIEFEEVNVMEDQEAAKELNEKTGATGVPVTVIDNNFDEAIIGFDEQKLREKLNIK